MTLNPVAPTLVLGWGNPSRGDDALGPMFIDAVLNMSNKGSSATRVETLSDFQLQVEHSLDLCGRDQVLFVDASRAGEEAFTVTAVKPSADTKLNSHALSPQSVLQVYRQVQGKDPPSSLLLAIRGYHFELGAGLSASAGKNLSAALHWYARWAPGTGTTEPLTMQDQRPEPRERTHRA